MNTIEMESIHNRIDEIHNSEFSIPSITGKLAQEVKDGKKLDLPKLIQGMNSQGSYLPLINDCHGHYIRLLKDHIVDTKLGFIINRLSKLQQLRLELIGLLSSLLKIRK